MTLPPEFLEDLRSRLDPFAKQHRTVADSEAVKVVGRAARVVFVVPIAGPFAAALWQALSESRRRNALGKREAPPGRHAARRFAVAAAWFQALIRCSGFGDTAVFPLQRVVSAAAPTSLALQGGAAIIGDASPWGGGAILVLGEQLVEYFDLEWSPNLCGLLGVSIGESRHLPLWEALVVLLSLDLWCGSDGLRDVAILGDNIGALTAALHLKARGEVLKVAREIALRLARFGVRVTVGHVPTEHNGLADALSRLYAPSPLKLPEDLQRLRRRAVPDPMALWHVVPKRRA